MVFTTDLLVKICLGLSAAGVVLLIVVLVRVLSSNDEQIERVIREEFRLSREESIHNARELREEVAAGQKAAIDSLIRTVDALGKSQKDLLQSVAVQVKNLTDSNETRIDRMRSTIDAQLKTLRENNQKKLDQMRETVDEKLQSTLERRLGESFSMVSERLEAVQRGLGEMQNLATGVGDLKRVLTNVKVRGTWGEVQLGALLEQVMTPDQYDANVQIRENSRENVEYAVRLPGKDDDPNGCVWLPIDSKFPQEAYLKLVEAADRAETDAVQRATAELVRAVHSAAKDIHDKYIDPPKSTDFAIMFLPTEGLYAEVLRQPGELEKILHTFRVVIAGPTTLSAILSSLRMGFRTLAIEKRSSEVWKVLAAVKTEFGRFGGILNRVKKQLHAASSTIDRTGARTRAMERRLRDVETLSSDVSAKILGLAETAANGIPDDPHADKTNAGTPNDGIPGAGTKDNSGGEAI
jgi:DNA recombination protein RmuC